MKNSITDGDSIEVLWNINLYSQMRDLNDETIFNIDIEKLEMREWSDEGRILSNFLFIK